MNSPEIRPVEPEELLRQDAEATNNPSRWDRLQDWFQHTRASRVVATAALAGGLAGGAYVVSQHETPDFKDVDITAVGRDVIDATEALAPFVIGLAAADVASMALLKGGRQNLKLAWRGMAPDSKNYYRNLVAGSLLPFIGITALSNALLIEEGVRNGPTQNIQAMADGIKTFAGSVAEDKQVVWGFQPGTYHFMNESAIPAADMQKVQAAASSTEDVQAVQPFDIKLTTIPTRHNPRQAGLLIYSDGVDGKPSPISPEVQPGAACELINQKCVLGPNELVVDSKEGLDIGDDVNIHGNTFKVVGFSKQDQSLINRMVAFTGLPEQKPSEYFGFAALANSKEDVEQLIRDLDLTKSINVESTAELIKFNKDFWAQNGTPLIMLMVGDIVIFAGATFISTRRYEQERNKSQIALLEAVGASKNQLSQQARARAAILTAKGILPAALAAVASEQLINSVLTGFHAELSPAMLAASTATILAVQVGASTKAMFPFGKRPTPAEQMKQD